MKLILPILKAFDSRQCLGGTSRFRDWSRRRRSVSRASQDRRLYRMPGPKLNHPLTFPQHFARFELPCGHASSHDITRVEAISARTTKQFS